ncbi:hypothetical protein DRP04_00070 [Archaeoglobales archaeon]|mgnify:CR=1 FL=1|jgi:hypothetical protein|nr:MAG: hypothetical protein DRP04_00070 [Archaeoglobales archaeon]
MVNRRNARSRNVCTCFGAANVIVTELWKNIERAVEYGEFEPSTSLDSLLNLMENVCGVDVSKERDELDKYIHHMREENLEAAINSAKSISYNLLSDLVSACEKEKI